MGRATSRAGDRSVATANKFAGVNKAGKAQPPLPRRISCRECNGLVPRGRGHAEPTFNIYSAVAIDAYDANFRQRLAVHVRYQDIVVHAIARARAAQALCTYVAAEPASLELPSSAC